MDSQSDWLIGALRLAALVEGSDDAIISKDINGIITSWNPAAERMFGYRADEAIGQSIRMIIPADRQSEEDFVLDRIRRGRPVHHFETVRCRRSGERFDVSISVSPIRTADGQVVGASKIARDISERKHTERALADARAEQAELRRRLTTIIDAAGGLLLSPQLDDVLPALIGVAREVLPADAYAVWRTRDSEWVTAASHGLSRRFVSTPIAMTPERRGLLTADLLVMESVDDARFAFRRETFRAEGLASMLLLPLQAGREVVAAIAFYYRAPHAFSGIERESASGLGRLASAVLSTAQLYEAQRHSRFQSEFMAQAGTILVSTLDYHDALTRLAGRAVPQVADWCTFHLQLQDERLERVVVATARGIDRELVERFVRSGESERAEPFSVERVVGTAMAVLVSHWRADECPGCAAARIDAGKVLGVESVICVPLVAHGRTFGTLSFGSVHPEHRFGAAELRFAEDVAYRAALAIDNIVLYEEARSANRLKDEFLANLSHELRTPLNAIVGYAQMLKKGTMPEERKARAYEVLDKNASALTQIVEDVLDISRIVTGKIRLTLAPVELSPIVVHSVETVQPGADAKGVQIDVDDAAAGAEVAGDADRLQQVFWNLLSNAVKFTARDGRIVVRVAREDGSCEVSVADNGAGIDPRFLPHIFERFRQEDSRYGRELGGLGLGLAIARQIVEMHGGTITAESAGPGRGSTFRVILPRLQR
jgi:PAS domain S-box-containing protein